MAKIKRILIPIVLALLLICVIAATFAVYSTATESGGTLTSKRFNTSNTVQTNLPLTIWLGETKYYYFEVSNTDDRQVPSAVDVNVSVSVNLRAFENKPFAGLTLTLEEYYGAGDDIYSSSKWRNITGGVSVITEDTLVGYSTAPLKANQIDKRHFRIKYTLPDTPDNQRLNGFYNADEMLLLNVKSAVDIVVAMKQA